jgi:hypothetical protein
VVEAVAYLLNEPPGLHAFVSFIQSVAQPPLRLLLQPWTLLRRRVAQEPGFQVRARRSSAGAHRVNHDPLSWHQPRSSILFPTLSSILLRLQVFEADLSELSVSECGHTLSSPKIRARFWKTVAQFSLNSLSSDYVECGRNKHFCIGNKRRL